MNKRQSKRQRDIKTKLMAAICMLLVSSIMMVSTTYAWFTLSTAPEVTGITTAVGANGNLEMALQPLTGESDTITSGQGDSVLDDLLRNITWGNLVDVSDDAIYGLNKILLYPAALNSTVVEGKDTIGEKPLQTPAYGADGRIASLESKTITGVYNPDGKFLEGYTGTIAGQDVSVTKAYGVRAIGTSSGMSDRQLAYRDALQAGNQAAAQAKTVAASSLEAKGAALADIAIKHATAEGATEEYTVNDLKNLMSIVDALLGTDPDAIDGSLEYIEEAMIQYALAAGLANVYSDDNYQEAITTFGNVDITSTTENLTTAMNTTDKVVSLTAVTNAIDELQAALDVVEDAKGMLNDLLHNDDGSEVASTTTYSWDDINDALTLLADPAAMQVNKIAVSQLKSNWLYDEDNDGPLPAGYYVADGTEENPGNVGYVYDEDGAIVSNMARLVDAVLGDGLQLIIRSGAGVFADIADFSGDYTASVTLSKISYGGMTVKNLDAKMSTKTSQGNNPYLTAAKNGVPGFSAGAGSSASAAINDYYGYIIDLAFRTNASGSKLQLQGEAMDRIYSDSKNEATMGHGATMNFKPTVESFSLEQVKSLMQCIRIVFFNTDDRVIMGYARLDHLHPKTEDDGSITMTLVMTDKDGVLKDNQEIMDLEQNTVHELSVMVYLDGEDIQNEDVAVGVSSMTGKMNLQFSSTAQLDPMDYTALKEGTGAVAPTTPSYTATDVENVTITDGYTVVTLKHVTDGTNNKLILVFSDGTGQVTEGVTVKIGDKTATYMTYGNYSGWVVDADATAPTGTVAVTVTTN